MATMMHCTTFALARGRTRSIKTSAKLWQVSQTEVVRRDVSLAEKPTTKVAKACLAEVREDHKMWRGS